ncbi:MAG: hypothetical protein O2800_00505 [Planctomycetota bacterium]|nr:hypothetical protein [Planctomycetota bacterium]
MFSTTEFTLVPSKVHFLCPHCEQEYLGNGEDGLPAPRQFECGRCHESVDVALMSARPAPGVTSQQCYTDDHPWLDRGDRGWISTFFTTMYRLSFQPAITARALHGRSSLLPSLVFAAGLSLIALLCWTLISLGIAGVTGALNAALLKTTAIVFAGGLAWLVIVLAIGFCACLTHLILRFGIPAPRPLSYTLSSILWSSAPILVGTSPLLTTGCCAVPLGWGWFTVNASIALSVAHSISVRRAVVAMIAPFVLVFAFVFFGLAFAVVSVGGAVGGATS